MDNLSTLTPFQATSANLATTVLSAIDVCEEDMEFLDLRSIPFDIIRSELFYHPMERILILIVSPILMAFGLIGNAGFLYIVAKLPEMRNFTNAFLANLAICDIIFIVATAYNILGVYVYSPDIESDPCNSSVGCVITFGLLHVTHYTSTAVVVFMSLERYFGICKPLLHRRIATKPRIRNIIILAWIIGFAFSFLIVPRLGKLIKTCILWPEDEEFKDLPAVIGECEPAHPFFNAIPFLVQAVPFFSAAIISLFIYGSVIAKLNVRVNEQVKAGVDNKQIAIERRARLIRNQVARLLIITGSVFILCYFPYYVLGVNEALLELSDSAIGFQGEHVGLVFLIVRLLVTINSVANPVIYSLSNARYRMAFVSVFCCLDVRYGRSSNSGSSSAASVSTNPK